MAAEAFAAPHAPIAVAAPAVAARFAWTVVALTVGSVIACATLAPEATARSGVTAGLAWLLFIGSSVHVAATGALFSFGEVRRHSRRHPARYLLMPVALLVMTATACVILPTPELSLLLLPFFGWQLWHYQKQNLGLAALAMTAARLPSLSLLERCCITASGLAGVLALVAHPDVLQIVSWRPAPDVAHATFILAAVLLSASLVSGCASMTRRGTTTAAAAVYLLAVAFPLPLVVARSPYVAIGGLTLAHGLQYLLLVGHVVIGPRRRRAGPDMTRLIALVSAVVAIAGLLAAGSHLHGDGHLTARLLFGGYLGVVMTHFVVDAGLWRLRDEFPRHWLGQRIPLLLGISG